MVWTVPKGPTFQQHGLDCKHLSALTDQLKEKRINLFIAIKNTEASTSDGSMATKRQKHSGSADGSLLQNGPSSVDKLAFKYMELCKVVSSTDSESDVSPRCSDTSTMGCVSSPAESRKPVVKTPTCVHKPMGRYLTHSLCVDPYDGSSEDSDESSGCPRRPRQGSCRYWGMRQRRTNHNPTVNLKEVIRGGGLRAGPPELHVVDIQMRSASESEIWICNQLAAPSPCDNLEWKTPVTGNSSDTGVVSAKSTPCTPGSLPFVGVATSIQVPRGSSEKDLDKPINMCFFKRKFSLPGVDSAEAQQEHAHRKRQCVTKMEMGVPLPEVPRT
ncbi:hypothetical protein UPYG_G00229850 [Umbra pygmaea]|uniref:Prolactin receptor n=1 Tax=Umbra pygmaea TaxID=75934 RepID=A0ABD0WD73_UMBPY